MKKLQLLSTSIAMALFVTVIGCNSGTEKTADEKSSGKTGQHVHADGTTHADHGEEGHAHGPGPHDGTVADWGEESSTLNLRSITTSRKQLFTCSGVMKKRRHRSTQLKLLSRSMSHRLQQRLRQALKKVTQKGKPLDLSVSMKDWVWFASTRARCPQSLTELLTPATSRKKLTIIRPLGQK